MKFLFIAPTKDEAFFGPVRRGMDDAARAMDVSVEFTGSTGVDTAEMVGLAREAVEQGYDGLAIDIFDPAAFKDVIAFAHASGVPVVAFNINAGQGSAGNLSGIAQRFHDAGRMLGTRARAQMKAGKVLITQHDAGISALEERRDGIVDGLADAGSGFIELITGHDPAEAARRIEKALKDDPSITAVLTTGQADTEGAAQAAPNVGRPVYLAGFDLSPAILSAIEAKVLDFTIDQQPYTQGFYPVVQLALNRRFGLVPVDMDAGAAVIDSTNVKQVVSLAAAGYR